jgi:hypothetical protein
MISNTLIHESTFATYPFVGLGYKLSLDITPTIVENLLQNTTISIYTHGPRNATTTAQQIIYEPVYLFKNPINLLAYVIALLISLAFILTGLYALLKNGVCAESSFLQILCTTTSKNVEINRLAEHACLGGSEGVSDELKNLKVRFGEIRGGVDGDDRGVRLAGFGTVEETIELVKGRSMGDVSVPVKVDSK